MESGLQSDQPQIGGVGALSGPLVEVLRELEGVIAGLSIDQYVARCGESFSNATIGGHVRHCLDHARALVDGNAAGLVDYDHRERGTPIESDPLAACAEARRLAAGVTSLSHAGVDRALDVLVMPTREGRSVRVRTTLGRELSFVLSHTIHHNAMVRGMALAVGAPVPPTFGYAPSTLAHANGSACAR